MEIKNFRRSNGPGASLATFDLSFINMGMTIRNLVLMETKGQKWISFPSKKYESEGKTKYYNYVVFEKEKFKDFTVKVFELLAPFLAKPSADSDCPF